MSADAPAFMLRAAQSADVDGITACVVAAYSPYIARMGRKPAPMLEDYARVIAERQVTVADAHGLIAGVLVLALSAEGLLLDNVAVLPTHRGMGKALLQHAESEARRQGFSSLDLYTHETMTENLALYAKIGYVIYDRRVDNGYARVSMRKSLQ